MNALELISSGKLELFVAGSLAEEEQAEVAAYAQKFPEVAWEIEEIQVAMLDYLPLDQIRMDAEESNALFTKICGGICLSQPAPPETGKSSHTLRPWTILIAAAMMGLIITTCSTVWLALKNRDLRSEMTALMTKNRWAEQGSRHLATHISQIDQQFALMRMVATRRIELRSVKGGKVAPGCYMLVYWNPLSEKLLMAGASLPGLRGNQQYHLWALNGATSVDAGVVDTAHPNDTFDNIPYADAFALTVEPKGGSKSPTLAHLCLMAKL